MVYIALDEDHWSKRCGTLLLYIDVYAVQGIARFLALLFLVQLVYIKQGIVKFFTHKPKTLEAFSIVTTTTAGCC